MIDSIRQIGQYATQNDGISLDAPEDVLKLLCEKPARSPAYRHIFTIEVKRDGESCSFVRVGSEEYSHDKIPRYMYRKGGANGPDFSLTSRLTEPGKFFPNKILGWLRQDFNGSVSGSDLRFLESLKQCITDHAEEIVDAFTEKSEAIRKDKENAIVTVIFSQNGTKKYIGDIPLFQNLFREKALNKYYSKYNTESRAKDQVCSICREKKDEVYGFVAPYAFYTVDKKGMVSGGFDQSLAWKNNPICRDCALLLEEGKKYLEECASFRFQGFDYFLIPKPVRPGVDTEVYDVIEEFHRHGAETHLSGKYMRLLDQAQDEVLDLLSRQENTFLCNILIYHAGKGEFKIDRYIEDVFPSRLRRLFDAKKKVDALPYISDLDVPSSTNWKRSGNVPYQFDLGTVRYFFRAEVDESLNGYFLDIVNKIFTGQLVDYQFLISAYMRKIRKLFAQNCPTRESSLRGLALLCYLSELGLLTNHTKRFTMIEPGIAEPIPEIPEPKAQEITDNIFELYADFFDTDAKKAIFLEGVLAQLLLDIQYYERNEDQQENRKVKLPFRVKLHGLSLDRRSVVALFPKIQNKLEEYGKNYYRDLEQLISQHMIQAGGEWRMSKDEISFYFTLGMNLAYRFKSQEKESENKAQIPTGDE
ncbi:MAG: TIGR02556 family CRISPR-associated protein [Candidatus Methanomethylophilaceae archaeon]|nr:TIGR02556 family CRISPR-associated protein [Candidatus Methanomethylophilaceae archaeon]